MSSILEALRKSDNKRQQNQSSASDKIQFSETAVNQKSRKGFYLLVLFLLIVAAVVWAQQAGYLDKLLLMASPEMVQAPEKNTQSTQTQQRAIPESQNKGLQPPKPREVKDQIVAKQSSAASGQNEAVDLVKDDEKKTAVDLVKAVDEEKEAAVDLVLAEPKEKPAAKGRLIVDGKDAKSESNVEKTDAQQKDKSKPQVQKQNYLLIHQLPFATRQQMPALKINVHVYDPEPDNRMVVINGVGFQIGDDIEGVAQIKDIVAEGVVIEAAGTVFLIPK